MHAYEPHRFSTSKPGADTRPPVELWSGGSPNSIPKLSGPMSVQYAEWREEPAQPICLGQIALKALSETPIWAWGAFGLVCVVAATESAYSLAGIIVFMWAMVWRAVASQNAKNQADKRLWQEMLALQEDGIPTQMPVSMKLLCHGFEFDEEPGILSLQEGSLYFCSHRTSFSFSSRTARKKTRWDIDPSIVYLRHGLEYLVTFKALDARQFMLYEMITQWSASRIGPGSIEVLPPTRPSNQASQAALLRAAKSLWNGVALSVVVASGSAGYVLATNTNDGQHWLEIAGLVLSFLIVTTARAVLIARRKIADLDALTAEYFGSTLKTRL